MPSDDTVPSPVTKNLIGKKLLPAIRHQNTILNLVDSGVIEGELAAKWKKKVIEKTHMYELLEKAQEGDCKAMYRVSYRYYLGSGAFPQDFYEAFQWAQRAHQKGFVVATCLMATMLLDGQGVHQNVQEGMMYLGIAAARGSDSACRRLGYAMADGLYGLPVKKDEAIYWLRLSLSDKCKYKTNNSRGKAHAKLKLKSLLRSDSNMTLDTLSEQSCEADSTERSSERSSDRNSDRSSGDGVEL